MTINEDFFIVMVDHTWQWHIKSKWMEKAVINTIEYVMHNIGFFSVVVIKHNIKLNDFLVWNKMAAISFNQSEWRHRR